MKSISKIFFLLIFFIAAGTDLYAQQGTSIPIPKIDFNIGTSSNPEEVSSTLQLLLLLTILSLAPSILIMTTSFLRLIIVFHFLRQALGTMQMPPNQLLAGIAMFVTFFIMQPTINNVNDNALQPYLNNEITVDSAYARGIKPVREFMLRNVRDEDLQLFISLSSDTQPEKKDDLSTMTLIPAFVISELRAGFVIGFFLFIPFLMIDMIVGSILMSMGMMMLPPMLVSLPFKILLFILVDGWNLIIGSLVRSFG
ncbi:MAG: flagellar type III secretion system pore protein FliP [Bacteroidetes bacterium]|nr:flagellar type III secretion system pore protein FliP [Bacteroidota bacterium]